MPMTDQFAQAVLRPPGETRVVSREAWQEGIAEGVTQGLFGLGALEDGKAVCHYFRKKPLVGLSSREVIVKAGICRAQQKAEKPPEVYPPCKPPEGPEIKEEEERRSARNGSSFACDSLCRKGRCLAFMGVMNLLQHKFDRLEITVRAAEGEIIEQEYEDKVQEAFRQLGIEVSEG